MNFYPTPGAPYVPQQPVNPYGCMGTVGLATPLPNTQMQQATAESIHTRTRYAVRVATSATGTGTFKYLGCFCRSHAGAPASIS